MNDHDRYHAAMHAVQSGVAASEDEGTGSQTPKHLRVGVNSALINDLALVNLLIEKRVFTMAEYSKAVADAAEAEVKLYEKRLSEKLGCDVRLS